MSKNSLVAPIIKWVGGKRQLANSFSALMPSPVKRYCEPFAGGCALLFHLQPEVAHINDINADLINVYEVTRDDVEALILELAAHKNDSAYFYTVRDWDRDKNLYERLTRVKKAARFIYLNKTCYNGLFRVNSAGEFNTPFGNYKKPNIVNAPTLRAVSAYLNSASIRITSLDYCELLDFLGKDAFVYLDPPYDPVSTTSNFTGYSKGGFGRHEQIRLRDFCMELDNRGIKFMLSNSPTDFIKALYSKFNITTVRAKRAINSVASRRGDVDEVVVRNYE